MFLKIVFQVILVAFAGGVVIQLCHTPVCSEEEAKSILSERGVTYNDTVDFRGIKCVTLEAVLWLEAESDCEILITGAREKEGNQTRIEDDERAENQTRSDTNGERETPSRLVRPRNNRNGFQLTIQNNTCLDDYIRTNFEYLEADRMIRYERYVSSRNFLYIALDDEWLLVA